MVVYGWLRVFSGGFVFGCWCVVDCSSRFWFNAFWMRFLALIVLVFSDSYLFWFYVGDLVVCVCLLLRFGFGCYWFVLMLLLGLLMCCLICLLLGSFICMILRLRLFVLNCFRCWLSGFVI